MLSNLFTTIFASGKFIQPSSWDSIAVLSRDTIPGYCPGICPGILSRDTLGKRFWIFGDLCPTPLSSYNLISVTLVTMGKSAKSNEPIRTVVSLEDGKESTQPKGWAFLSKKDKNNARAATTKALEKIEIGQFTKLGELDPPISKVLAEKIFRAMVKAAAQRQREYDFPIGQLLFSQAVKNCVSFVIANKLHDAAIDTMDIKTIMKITPGLFSTLHPQLPSSYLLSPTSRCP